MYVSTLWNILSSANQFVFLSKSICFPQQINLFSSANQFVLLNYMTFAAMLNDVLDDVEWRSRWCWVTLMTMQFQWVWSANSLNFLSKFIEIGQQIHWVYSANSLKLQSKFIEFTNGNDVSSWQAVVYTQSQRPSISFTKRLPTLPNHSCHTLTCCCPWRVEARCNPVIRQR